MSMEPESDEQVVDPEFKFRVIEGVGEALALLFIVLAVLNASVETMVLAALCAGLSFAGFLGRLSRKLIVVDRDHLIIAIGCIAGLEFVVVAGAIVFSSSFCLALAAAGLLAALPFVIALVVGKKPPTLAQDRRT